ncbi:lysophospholipid acyltransferase family protein [bacterium]|nr:lysophospholipid acyltransferase family protein [bacterium]
MGQKQLFVSARLARRFPALRTAIWRLELLVVKFFVWVVRCLSPERAARLAHFIFRNLAPTLPFTTKIRRNLGVAFPHASDRDIKKLTVKTCGNLGIAVVDVILSQRLWAERKQRIEFVMEDGVDLAGYTGKPVVLVTGHIGAWQLASFVAVRYNLRVTSVFAPEKNPYLRDYLGSLRSELPFTFISRDGCMRALAKELKCGNVLGLASDTRMDGGDSLSFFGVQTPSNTSLARLALRYDCDFIPVRAERLPGMHFRITAYRPIRSDNPDAPVAEQARQMTQSMLNHFEAWIRDTPDQWMCFGRRWPHEAYSSVPVAKQSKLES